jgi:hypothetical protein
VSKSYQTYLKAIVGGLVSGLTSLQIALPDGVSSYEWISVALAVLAGAGLVYAVPNKEPKIGDHEPPL